MSVSISWYSYKAAEKIDRSQIKPLIQIRPINIVSKPRFNFHDVEIVFSILNHSEFDASNLSIDIKVGDHSWKNEFLKAVGYNNLKQLRKKIKTGEICQIDQDGKRLPADKKFL